MKDYGWATWAPSMVWQLSCSSRVKKKFLIFHQKVFRLFLGIFSYLITLIDNCLQDVWINFLLVDCSSWGVFSLLKIWQLSSLQIFFFFSFFPLLTAGWVLSLPLIWSPWNLGGVMVNKYDLSAIRDCFIGCGVQASLPIK